MSFPSGSYAALAARLGAPRAWIDERNSEQLRYSDLPIDELLQGPASLPVKMSAVALLMLYRYNERREELQFQSVAIDTQMPSSPYGALMALSATIVRTVLGEFMQHGVMRLLSSGQNSQELLQVGSALREALAHRAGSVTDHIVTLSAITQRGLALTDEQLPAGARHWLLALNTALLAFSTAYRQLDPRWTGRELLGNLEAILGGLNTVLGSAAVQHVTGEEYARQLVKILEAPRVLVADLLQEKLLGPDNKPLQLEDLLGTSQLVEALLPEDTRWLFVLFDSLIQIVKEFQLPAHGVQGASVLDNTLRLIRLLVQSPIPELLIGRSETGLDGFYVLVKNTLAPTSAPAADTQEVVHPTFIDKANWVLRQLANPSNYTRVHRALIGPGNAESWLLSAVHRSSRLLLRAQSYDGDGSWQSKMGWGTDLLASSDSAYLLELMLPQTVAKPLNAGLSFARDVKSWPTQLSLSQQGEWAARTVAEDQHLMLLKTLLPNSAMLGVEQTLKWAPLMIKAGQTWEQRPEGAGEGKMIQLAPLVIQLLNAELTKGAAGITAVFLTNPMTAMLLAVLAFSVETYQAGRTFPQSMAQLKTEGIGFVAPFLLKTFPFLASSTVILRAQLATSEIATTAWHDLTRGHTSRDSLLNYLTTLLKRYLGLSGSAAYLLDLAAMVPLLDSVLSNDRDLATNGSLAVRLNALLAQLSTSQNPVIQALGANLNERLATVAVQAARRWSSPAQGTPQAIPLVLAPDVLRTQLPVEHKPQVGAFGLPGATAGALPASRSFAHVTAMPTPDNEATGPAAVSPPSPALLQATNYTPALAYGGAALAAGVATMMAGVMAKRAYSQRTAAALPTEPKAIEMKLLRRADDGGGDDVENDQDNDNEKTPMSTVEAISDSLKKSRLEENLWVGAAVAGTVLTAFLGIKSYQSAQQAQADHLFQELLLPLSPGSEETAIDHIIEQLGQAVKVDARLLDDQELFEAAYTAILQAPVRHLRRARREVSESASQHPEPANLDLTVEEEDKLADLSGGIIKHLKQTDPDITLETTIKITKAPLRALFNTELTVEDTPLPPRNPYEENQHLFSVEAFAQYELDRLWAVHYPLITQGRSMFSERRTLDETVLLSHQAWNDNPLHYVVHVLTLSSFGHFYPSWSIQPRDVNKRITLGQLVLGQQDNELGMNSFDIRFPNPALFYKALADNPTLENYKKALGSFNKTHEVTIKNQLDLQTDLLLKQALNLQGYAPLERLAQGKAKLIPVYMSQARAWDDRNKQTRPQVEQRRVDKPLRDTVCYQDREQHLSVIVFLKDGYAIDIYHRDSPMRRNIIRDPNDLLHVIEALPARERGDSLAYVAGNFPDLALDEASRAATSQTPESRTAVLQTLREIKANQREANRSNDGISLYVGEHPESLAAFKDRRLADYNEDLYDSMNEATESRWSRRLKWWLHKIEFAGNLLATALAVASLNPSYLMATAAKSTALTAARAVAMKATASQTAGALAKGAWIAAIVTSSTVQLTRIMLAKNNEETSEAWLVWVSTLALETLGYKFGELLDAFTTAMKGIETSAAVHSYVKARLLKKARVAARRAVEYAVVSTGLRKFGEWEAIFSKIDWDGMVPAQREDIPAPKVLPGEIPLDRAQDIPANEQFVVTEKHNGHGAFLRRLPSGVRGRWAQGLPDGIELPSDLAQLLDRQSSAPTAQLARFELISQEQYLSHVDQGLDSETEYRSFENHYYRKLTNADRGRRNIGVEFEISDNPGRAFQLRVIHPEKNDFAPKDLPPPLFMDRGVRWMRVDHSRVQSRSAAAFVRYHIEGHYYQRLTAEDCDRTGIAQEYKILVHPNGPVLAVAVTDEEREYTKQRKVAYEQRWVINDRPLASAHVYETVDGLTYRLLRHDDDARTYTAEYRFVTSGSRRVVSGPSDQPEFSMVDTLKAERVPENERLFSANDLHPSGSFRDSYSAPYRGRWTQRPQPPSGSSLQPGIYLQTPKGLYTYTLKQSPLSPGYLDHMSALAAYEPKAFAGNTLSVVMPAPRAPIPALPSKETTRAPKVVQEVRATGPETSDDHAVVNVFRTQHEDQQDPPLG